MTVKREQELWALALWVEREFGDEGERFIAERVLHFALEAEEGGKHLWLNGIHPVKAAPVSVSGHWV